jgi:beta-glucanase (GH16 family)
MDGISQKRSEVFTEKPVCTADWVLVYEDNFDSTALNPAVWKIINGADNDDIYFSANNVVLQDGTLKLMNRKENKDSVMVVTRWDDPNTPGNEYAFHYRNWSYTGAQIETRKTYKYGKFEIRCKIEHGSGFWPAFWLWGVGPAGDYNELDVFEFLNNDNQNIRMTIHYPAPHDQAGFSYAGIDYSLGYHTFSVEWDKFVIIWRIDGNIVNTYYQYFKRRHNVPCDSIQPNKKYRMKKYFPKDGMWVAISTQIGYSHHPVDSCLPNSMDVDYVRFYKRISELDEL